MNELIANPKHRQELDKRDNVSVWPYWLGISLFSVALLGCVVIA
ncbi:hypothetical protein [Vibrio methylphosphonaticus]|nr:hypothetical protein [Vibrio methylphosphonaticus]